MVPVSQYIPSIGLALFWGHWETPLFQYKTLCLLNFQQKNKHRQNVTLVQCTYSFLNFLFKYQTQHLCEEYLLHMFQSVTLIQIWLICHMIEMTAKHKVRLHVYFSQMVLAYMSSEWSVQLFRESIKLNVYFFRKKVEDEMVQWLAPWAQLFTQCTSSRLNLNLGLFISLFKCLFGTIFFVLFRASNNQIIDEENWTEFSFEAFKSETRIHTNPGLS